MKVQHAARADQITEDDCAVAGHFITPPRLPDFAI
jgi:hypothetical protein